MKLFKVQHIGKSYKVFLTALFANLLIMIVYGYIFVQVRHKNQNIADLTKAVVDLTKQKENLKSAKEVVSESVLLRDTISGYFIPRDGVVAFLNSMENMASRNYLELEVLSVSVAPARVSPDVFEVVTGSLEVFGTWSDVYRFVALTELMPYKVYLRKVSVEKFFDESLETSAGSSKKSAGV